MLHTVTVNDPYPGAVGSAPVAAAPGPATVSRAALAGIHHRASGAAVLLQLADGSVIRVETLDVEPGPDDFVLVGPAPTGATPTAERE